MEWIVAAVAVSWVTLVLVAFLCYRLTTRLLAQQGGILLTVERHEEILAKEWRPRLLGEPLPAPTGLSAGTPAPGFSLQSLRDPSEHLTLDQLRGKKALLLFFGPICTHCDALAPKIAELPIDGSNGSPIPIVVTNGPGEHNAKYLTKHKLPGPVMLAEGSIYQDYQVDQTPTAYIIDEQGTLMTGLLVGGDPILSAVQDVASKSTSVKNGHDRGSSIADGTVLAQSS